MALPSYFSDVWKKTVQAESQPHDDYKCKKQEKENGLKAMFPVWCPDGLVETSVLEMVKSNTLLNLCFLLYSDRKALENKCL